MPRINQYTRQVAPQGLNVQASADDFGAAQGRVMEQAGNVAIEINERQIEAARRLQAREETIKVMREIDKFNNEAFNELNRAQTEEDIVDPAVSTGFNQRIRENMQNILNNYQGSPEGKAKLESELMDITSKYGQQMNIKALGAQRAFIMGKAGEKMNQLTAQVLQDPSSFGETLQRGYAVVDDLSAAMSYEDAESLRGAFKANLSENAVYHYIDKGDYETASDFIANNPDVMEFLPPEKQRQMLKQIDSGIAQKRKAIDEVKEKVEVFNWMSDKLGVKPDPYQVMSAVTGVDIGEPPDKTLKRYADTFGLAPEDVPSDVVAQIRFPQLKLNKQTEMDPNKAYGPDNKLTVSGIADKIKKPRDLAINMSMQSDMALEAIKAFENDGNNAALIAAITSFKKILDPTSAVMEGEVRLQAEADDLANRIERYFVPGQVIGTGQVKEIKSLIGGLRKKYIGLQKAEIDPLLEDADARGFRRIDLNMPETVYNDVFRKGVEGVPEEAKKGSLSEMTTEDLEKMLKNAQ